MFEPRFDELRVTVSLEGHIAHTQIEARQRVSDALSDIGVLPVGGVGSLGGETTATQQGEHGRTVASEGHRHVRKLRRAVGADPDYAFAQRAFAP